MLTITISVLPIDLSDVIVAAPNIVNVGLSPVLSLGSHFPTLSKERCDCRFGYDWD